MSLGYFDSGAGGARAGAALCVVPCVCQCGGAERAPSCAEDGRSRVRGSRETREVLYLETLKGHHAANQIQPKPLAIVASPRLTTHPQTHQTQPSSHDWLNMRPALQISSLGASRVQPGWPRFFPQPAERTTSQPAAALDELELERRGLLCCAAGDALGRLERHLQ